MNLKYRTKELFIDILVKVFQIFFATLVVGSFVSGVFRVDLIFAGAIGCVFCLIIACTISEGYTEKEESLCM